MITPGALQGIKVLDLSRMLPGPYCSMILADHGAEVIAIEESRFRQDGLFFKELNRNKRHMSLNLKTDQGRNIFYALTRDADVVIEGFRPGVVKRLGVDYHSLSKINPRIIFCSISGFGQTGPMVDRVGHDVNYLSSAGLLDLIGEENRSPVIPGIQIADIAGGSMHAAVGILLALFAREKSGKGQYIDISMTDGILGMLALPYFFSKLTGRRQERSNEMLSHRFACYNIYETKDGRYLAIGALEHRFWHRLCVELQLEEFSALQYDEGRRKEIIDMFRSVFLQRPLAEWEAVLGCLDVCFSAVKTMDEVLEEPLFREREMVHTYRDFEGQETYDFGIAVKLSGTPGSIRTKPDSFGAHTREILGELGYKETEIDDLYTCGVL